MSMQLGRFSMGIGDRFAKQGEAQLRAMVRAREAGVEVTPVWNKSFREHSIVHTVPMDVRREADAAVQALHWDLPYFVDADHIGMKNVEGFLDACDFFTLDVADFIGKAESALPEAECRAFAKRHGRLCGTLALPGLARRVEIDGGQLEAAARTFLPAVREAGRLYRRIEQAKGKGRFVAEVSMDETERPQQPADMLVILAALAEEGVAARTVAPKFTGRFNKGVDYVGDVEAFTREFEADVAVIRYAVETFGLPADLKLSVHSGSDKFSLYGPMHRVLRATGAGVHLKTAGTTWLEEIAGLAAAGADGLILAKRLYVEARARLDELCKPYASVIDINPARLPAPQDVAGWTASRFVEAVAHDPRAAGFHADMRQLMHVGYRVAAEAGDEFLGALDRYRETIASRVQANLLERHIKPLFLGE
jgi:hypothetical protein